MDSVKMGDLTIGTGIPKICVPIVAGSEKEILSAAAQLAREACLDLVEWRADFFDRIEDSEAVLSLLAQLRGVMGSKPILFTFRSKKEGGQRELCFHQYAQLNVEVAGSGLADLVDVEAFRQQDETPRLVEEIHQAGGKVILSNHSFTETPPQPEILRRLQQMAEWGCDIAKVAVMPTCPEDVLALLSATQQAKSLLRCPVVTMSMGGQGVVSRISGGLFGSAITFGAVGKCSAPGQLPVKELHSILHTLQQAGMEA